jgi:hypothetical protein
MSAEIARIEPVPSRLVTQQDEMQNRAVARLSEWAQAASAAYVVAERLVTTSFCPQQFRGKPEEAAAAILSGSEVGLSPIASLKAFDIIQNTAAPRALTLRAIVQSQGHEIIVEESTETRCKVRGRRRDSSEWVKVTWTMDRAKGLGLATKDNWKKQPGAMLVARATSELARLIAADAILGIGYVAEEIADGADVTVQPDSTPAAVEAPKKRTMKRKPPKDDDPPHQPTGDEAAELVAPPADPMTDDQQRKMFKQFNDLGITVRDDYRGYIQKVIGRDIESSKELSKAEASSVIEAQIADLEKKEHA